MVLLKHAQRYECIEEVMKATWMEAKPRPDLLCCKRSFCD
jgi:hypothetical protein